MQMLRHGGRVVIRGRRPYGSSPRRQGPYDSSGYQSLNDSVIPLDYVRRLREASISSVDSEYDSGLGEPNEVG